MTQRLVHPAASDKTREQIMKEWMKGKSVMSKLKTAFQTSAVDRRVLNCDVDVDDLNNGVIGDDKRKLLHLYFVQHDLYKHIILTIKTRGGYHILFDSQSLKEKFPLVTSFRHLAVRDPQEITKPVKHNNLRYWFNTDTNCQVPLPGTYQGSYPVRIVNLHEELNSMFSSS